MHQSESRCFAGVLMRSSKMAMQVRGMQRLRNLMVLDLSSNLIKDVDPAKLPFSLQMIQVRKRP